MKRFLTKEWKSSNHVTGEAGKIHKGLLLLVFIVLAAAGYIYYFTDMAGRDTVTVSIAPVSSLVKKPLPPRSAIPEGMREPEPATPPQQAALPPDNTTGAGQPAPVVPAQAKKTVSAAEQAVKQTTEKAEAEKSIQKLTVGKQPLKTVPSKTAPVKNASSSGSKTTDTMKPDSGREKNHAATPAKPAKGAYTLQIGVFATEKGLAAEKTRLKSAGLQPIIIKGPKKMEPMHRLFIGEFDSYPEASIELLKVKKISGDAFILPENEKFVLYAGSYSVQERAKKEQERLSEGGLKPLIRKTNVPVATYRLTAGNFADRKFAEHEAERLKKMGIKSTVVTSGL
jgi:cell division septation protein DedD